MTPEDAANLKKFLLPKLAFCQSWFEHDLLAEINKFSKFVAYPVMANLMKQSFEEDWAAIFHAPSECVNPGIATDSKAKQDIAAKWNSRDRLRREAERN